MTKRSLVFSAVFTGVIASTAMAADMPVKAYPHQNVSRGCANFGGFYLGGQVGYTGYNNNWNDLDRFGPNTVGGIGLEVQQTGNGGAFGVQAGYNMQSGCTVFGIESDW